MNDPLWTSGEAARATGGECTREWNATGLSIDTRTLAPGDLFIALRANRDGHDFVAQALASGAAAAMVDHVPDGMDRDASLLVVDDVQAGLERLARHARARTAARVIAVTGSVGKTTTKEMLRRALDGQGRIHAAEASYNNHWGVPLTLARMPAGTAFAVIEIGMSNPGEIAPLACLARPDVALVTTVAPAHLAAFDDVEGIAREKASITEGLEPGGVAILPASVPVAIRDVLTHHAQGSQLWFGEGDDAAARLDSLTATDAGSVARLSLPGGEAVVKIAAPGRHLAINALGALAACVAAGADLARSAVGIGTWTPVGGRGLRERIALDPDRSEAAIVLIDDAFNANPASMAAALEVLALAEPGPGGRRIAVLGDMLELGRGGAALHEALAHLPAVDAIDAVHCAGPLAGAMFDALPERRRGFRTDTAEEMAARIRTMLRPGDVVLVKGSKGARTALVVDAIRKLGQSAEIKDGIRA